jgi:hypothetical protein
MQWLINGVNNYINPLTTYKRGIMIEQDMQNLSDNFWKYVTANDKKVTELVKNLKLAELRILNLQKMVYDGATMEEIVKETLDRANLREHLMDGLYSNTNGEIK